MLNGLKLDVEWDGTTAHGHGFLDIDGGKEAQWHISCLFNSVVVGRGNSPTAGVVHVLSLAFGASTDGFTISYEQSGSPAILRFKSKYYGLHVIDSPESASRWRIPSLEFDPEILAKVDANRRPTLTQSFDRSQKSLGEYLKALEGSLVGGVHKALEHLCPKHRGGSKDQAVAISSLGTAPVQVGENNEQDTAVIKAHNPTNIIPSDSTAKFRVLKWPGTSHTSVTSSATPSLPFPSGQQIHILKVFGLILILSSLFVWICLQCRDPRRRAECLARREERRNRKLYRRAARQHKVKMWFWNFRMRYGLAPSETLNWNEKETRVSQPESILDRVMTNEIHALRDAHGVVNSIAAAEEGRYNLASDSDGFERRRSVSTLPGYESEGSLPPNYDDVGSSLGSTTLVNGFGYNSVEAEFRSDSSVISTSPRISRDGTNSDFDEKFEPILLETTGPSRSGL